MKIFSVWLSILFVMPAYAFELPLPVQSFQTDGTFVTLSSNSSLDVPESILSKFNASINEIRKTISSYPQKVHPISIRIEIAKFVGNLPKNIRDALTLHKESYWIGTSSKDIHIMASNDAGALHALTTLEGITSRNNGLMPIGNIIDWPTLKFRGVLIVPGPGVTSSDLIRAISEARKARMNALIFYINRRLAFETFKGTAPPGALSLQEIREIVAYANSSGLEVIPLINLLSHQSNVGLMQDAKKLGIAHSMYNDDTYDPADAGNYKIVFSFLNEIIDVMHPRKIHIGHDEVRGCYPKHQKSMLENGQNMLSSTLFLKDVLKLYDFLKMHDIETWMWGDMLLPREEFPQMHRDGLNGSFPGYGKSLRRQLPKEIVITDWHYKDEQKTFPSTKAFADEGFHVVGTTWKNPSTITNFTKYMSSEVGPNGLGMVAGIWGFWQLSSTERNDLISVSGNMFWDGK